ncbi:CidA/LrgA family protein [Gaoshiqia sediminis]|uniref:CidA/LrgA family protein n=1 Tax=Gaoshiqia sediminis TaxID=2986998 RepID=A0AA41Y987_9BACT|nr:CidA/LrgA family protein [Gaoshiqia sediminis]MCW0481733.1 CidA/LrgA family protein [Gaoshiqia sediminis]
MKIFKQLLVILGLSFGGELLSNLFNLPIPGSITGMILLLILLLMGVIKERHIAETSDFLLGNMGFFFIPAGVGILVSYQSLKGNYIEAISVIILSTLLVLAVTSLVTQLLIKSEKKHDRKVD